MNTTIIGAPQDCNALYRCLKSGIEYNTIDFNPQETPDSLLASLYDSLHTSECIIVSIMDPELSRSVVYTLTNSSCINIPIIDFYLYYRLTIPLMKADRFMSIPGKEYEGMILGLSHSEIGLISELFEIPFCNLSVGSQDLYYNLKALEYCISKYPHKISKLKYLIVDLYDYTYFNFDTSMSRHFLNYISWGGISFDPHNFDKNSNFDMSFNDALNAVLASVYEGVTEEIMDWWDMLFTNPHSYDNFKFFGDYDTIKARTSKMTPEMIMDFDIHAGIIEKRFPETISENIECLRQLLLAAKKLNPEIDIYCITIPRYKELQERLHSVHQKWKEEFCTIIKTLQEEIPFKYLDFNNDPIAYSQDNYYDASHFNMFGAIKFTRIMNEKIFH